MRPGLLFEDGRVFFFVPEPFYIVGPTAVGKTAVAVEAAALCGAEIVSADAFQVYAGLEVLTAKPSRDDLTRVRHHLIGHVPRSESYHVARYHQEASQCLQDAARRERPVIVVGGSGLYIKALTHGLSPLPPAQPELRAELERTSLPELVARLQTLDPVAAGKIDIRNKRRVVRAVEVCIATGGRFSDHQITWQEERPPTHGVLLVRDKEELAERISKRAEDLLTETSLDEVREAMRSPMSETASQIIGLKEVEAFIQGKIARTKCLEQIRLTTRRYAKRQMTWFRKEAFAGTIHLTPKSDLFACAKVIAASVLGLGSSIRDKPLQP